MTKKPIPQKWTELSILDRFLIIPLLPQTGDLKTITRAKFLARKVECKEDDMKILMKSVTPNGDLIPSEESKSGVKKFDLSFEEFELIRAGLNKLDQDKQLTPAHLDLYYKFFPEENPLEDNQEENDGGKKSTDDEPTRTDTVVG